MLVLWSLALSAFLSATLLPGTSEALLVALLIEESTSPALLLLFATVGNVAGSIVNWFLGMFFMHFRDRKWFPVSARQIEKATNWYAKYGVWSLLLAWLPVIGDPLTLVAGIMRTRFVTFLILVSVGKFLRYLVITASVLAWF